MAKVLIQSGHEEPYDGAVGASAYGLVERDLNTIVTNEAVANLRAAGITVVRQGGQDPKLRDERDLDLAIAVHFDGNPQATSQVLYDDHTDKAASALWKQMYGQVWSFGFMNDNTTPLADSTGYSRYYGFPHWFTKDGEMVIEFGSIGNPAQAEWLKEDYPNKVKWLGDCLQRFVRVRLGLINVEMVPYEQSPYNPSPAPTPPSDLDALVAKLRQQLADTEAARAAEQKVINEQTIRIRALVAKIAKAQRVLAQP